MDVPRPILFAALDAFEGAPGLDPYRAMEAALAVAIRAERDRCAVIATTGGTRSQVVEGIRSGRPIS